MSGRFEWREVTTEYRDVLSSPRGDELRWLVNRERMRDTVTGATVTRSIMRSPGVCDGADPARPSYPPRAPVPLSRRRRSAARADRRAALHTSRSTKGVPIMRGIDATPMIKAAKEKESAAVATELVATVIELKTIAVLR
jgi:hypothetical protein